MTCPALGGWIQRNEKINMKRVFAVIDRHRAHAIIPYHEGEGVHCGTKKIPQNFEHSTCIGVSSPKNLHACPTGLLRFSWSVCLSLALSLSVCLSLSVSLSLALSLSLSLSFPLSLSISPSRSPSLASQTHIRKM